MSNLTKGKKVRIKATGEIGIIKDIDRVKRADGKHEDVTFLIKRQDGAGWIQCGRHALELLVPVKTDDKSVYPKVYTIKKDVGTRTITVVGVVDILKDVPYTEIENGDITIDKGKSKRFAIGWSICHPDDADSDLGFKLALKRCDERPMAEYYCAYLGEFREDIVMAMLNVKMDYIENNLDKFINKTR